MIAIACDHAGVELKNSIIQLLRERGLTYTDFGTNTRESVDYPDYAKAAADAVASGHAERGILICGTGIGMSIAANKVRGIRCALCGDVFSAEAARRHNDSNVLALGARVTGEGLALKITEVWLDTRFDDADDPNGRHRRRIARIEG
ncbi:MAG: ribose 5-phosphate isomerase B [Oscillospiraceae bacterium]|jgi:ribose 5-phosphate isomerase B|nr:ribose 5-phosphate isomerase B [Oscillospiraceae bacterium]